MGDLFLLVSLFRDRMPGQARSNIALSVLLVCYGLRQRVLMVKHRE